MACKTRCQKKQLNDQAVNVYDMFRETLLARKTYTQRGFVCALHFADLLPAFVELERGHRLDAARLRRLSVRVHVNLGEDNGGELFCHLFVDGRDHLAGATPCCGKVNNDQSAVRVAVVVQRVSIVNARALERHHSTAIDVDGIDALETSRRHSCF